MNAPRCSVDGWNEQALNLGLRWLDPSKQIMVFGKEITLKKNLPLERAGKRAQQKQRKQITEGPRLQLVVP